MDELVDLALGGLFVQGDHVGRHKMHETFKKTCEKRLPFILKLNVYNKLLRLQDGVGTHVETDLDCIPQN